MLGLTSRQMALCLENWINQEVPRLETHAHRGFPACDFNLHGIWAGKVYLGHGGVVHYIWRYHKHLRFDLASPVCFPAILGELRSDLEEYNRRSGFGPAYRNGVV